VARHVPLTDLLPLLRCIAASTGSRKNIEEHYDAGNAMYAAFLDDSMTYSAGIHTEVRIKDEISAVTGMPAPSQQLQQ
jgi:hypothetical protein